MKLQRRVYLVFALLGEGLFLYMLYLSIAALDRYGASGTAAVPLILAVGFAAFGGFYAWIAFLFSCRAVAAMSSVAGGVKLEPFQRSFPVPIVVPVVTKLRTIGAQFSQDESAPAFTLFTAAGKSWVVSSAAYHETPAHEA